VSDGVRLVLSEEDRQLVLLALAVLSLESPGLDYAANCVAVRMDNVVDGRAVMYGDFRHCRADGAPRPRTAVGQALHTTGVDNLEAFRAGLRRGSNDPRDAPLEGAGDASPQGLGSELRNASYGLHAPAYAAQRRDPPPPSMPSADDASAQPSGHGGLAAACARCSRAGSMGVRVCLACFHYLTRPGA
jgi:hypothetical protein